MHPEVREALRARRPVVALETAVLTHGLPREPLADAAATIASTWDTTQPTHLEAARLCEQTIREAGAVPATVGVLRGRVHVGLTDTERATLANDRQAVKASATNLASILTDGLSAGTTVSGTLAILRLVKEPALRVLATGGIGGVHPGWTSCLDVSTDLTELGQTPVCVVCAGAKSILDIPATLEVLETLGVPVVGYQTTAFPRFYCVGDGGVGVAQHVQSAAAAATLCGHHWRTLERATGVVLAVEPPARTALDQTELNRHIAQANDHATQRGALGAERTPFILAEIARLTHGASVLANIDLLRRNAEVAAEVGKLFAHSDLW